jgi:hypothetical protein
VGIFEDGLGLLRGQDLGTDNLNQAGKGAADLAQGIADDGFSSDKTWSGIHDLLRGGAGEAGERGGASPFGKVMKAFSFGMDIGDAIAPVIFGDMEQPGSRMEEIPEDGVFKPSTGNKVVDAAIEGIGDAAEFVQDIIPSKMPSLPSISLPSISLPSLF